MATLHRIKPTSGPDRTDQAPLAGEAATEVGVEQDDPSDVSPFVRGVVYAVLAPFAAVICCLVLVVLWRLA